MRLWWVDDFLTDREFWHVAQLTTYWFLFFLPLGVLSLGRLTRRDDCFFDGLLEYACAKRPRKGKG